MYCCQLYFNMNRGYAVAKNAVCGLYNDDGQATILQDETTGQYYIWAYYVVADKSPSFSHQFTEAEIMKGKRRNYIGYCQQCRKLSVADESKEKHRKICVAQHK